MTQELALTESRTLREEYADRIDVLDKVKALSLLPDSTHADLPSVATYYEVGVDAVESAVRRNRDELNENGMRVLRGQEYRDFATVNLTDANPNTRSITLFTRRAILNVGQLLRDSEIAKAVRTYLLDIEEIAGPEIRTEAVERAELSHAQVRMLKAADGLLDHGWLASKAKVVIARGLGEEPELDPMDVPLYVPDFVKAKGVTRKADIESIQSWFGRRVAGLYEEAHGVKPGKRTSELPNGQIRETYAWTQRDLPLFEEVWEVHYAAKYTPQTELSLIDGGA
jgi:hypothetical protein